MSNPLNTSVSKQQYSFSKSSRFHNPRPLNHTVSYSNPSQFSNKKDSGQGRAFFHTSTRFDYYRSAKKEAKSPQPSPNNYKIKDTFGQDTLTSQK